MRESDVIKMMMTKDLMLFKHGTEPNSLKNKNTKQYVLKEKAIKVPKSCCIAKQCGIPTLH